MFVFRQHDCHIPAPHILLKILQVVVLLSQLLGLGHLSLLLTGLLVPARPLCCVSHPQPHLGVALVPQTPKEAGSGGRGWKASQLWAGVCGLERRGDVS